jgi:hypothetical protein
MNEEKTGRRFNLIAAPFKSIGAAETAYRNSTY